MGNDTLFNSYITEMFVFAYYFSSIWMSFIAQNTIVII